MSTEFTKLSDGLIALLKKFGLMDIVDRSELQEKFCEIVGEQIANQTKIKNFENGVLTIEVESSVWKNELFFMRDQIKDRINQSFKRKIVKQIRIV